MCRAIDKWVESATRKAMKEGEKRGEKRGKKEGKEELLQSIILRMLSQARPVADIIAMTGTKMTLIRSVAKQNNLVLL